MRWDLLENGKYMIYKWGEKDGKVDNGTTLSASIELLGNKIVTSDVTLKIFPNDDPAGDAFVYYDNDNLTIYNTGSVKFEIEIK